MSAGEIGRAERRAALSAAVDEVRAELAAAHGGREIALPACRRAIRAAGSSIRAVHRLEHADATRLAAEATSALREAQEALAGFPAVAHAGFLHDAEREVAEAHLTAALVAGRALPGPAELGVDGAPWLKALAEAASELRRSTLDLLRQGSLEEAEGLLGAMDDAYDVLMTVDFPDALTEGLRRTVDALRAVVERTRGDVTATVVQSRLQRALEQGGTVPPGATPPAGT
jgi:translin